MTSKLKILITNDDGYTAKGIQVLVGIMRQFGSVKVIAPKYHQSGMSMAVTLGGRAIAVKQIAEDSYYVDATPASCVKYGIDEVYPPSKPDVVICGINHGSNAATAANYSGTLGAAEEAALNGILGIGVSLDAISPDADFTVVEELFPQIFTKILENPTSAKGVFYNVNFPSLPASEVKGVRVGHMGMGHWEREFRRWDTSFFESRGATAESMGLSSNPPREEGETLMMMIGDFVDDSPAIDHLADHHLVADGYVSITAHNIDYSDPAEAERLRSLGFDEDFLPADKQQ